MRTPRCRVLAVLFAVLALFAGACVDDGELGGPSVGGSFAASVGEATLTHGDLAAMVDNWASNPQFLSDAVGISELGRAGARPAELVSFVLGFWVEAEQARAIAPSVDPSLDIEAESAAIADELRAQIPSFGDFDEDFQRQVAEWVGLRSLFQQGAADLDIPNVEVNPRYGAAVDVGGLKSVEPPDGPRSAPGGNGLGI